MLDTNYRTVTIFQGTIWAVVEKEHIRLMKKIQLFSMLLTHYIMQKQRKKNIFLQVLWIFLDNMIPKGRYKCFYRCQKSDHSGSAETNRTVNLQEAIKRKVEKLMLQYDDGIFLLISYIKDTCHILTLSDKDRGKDKGILNDYGKMQIRYHQKSCQVQMICQGRSNRIGLMILKNPSYSVWREAQHHKPLKK